jgi:hypothetical protein
MNNVHVMKTVCTTNGVHSVMYVVICRYFTTINLCFTEFRINSVLTPEFLFKKGQAVMSKISGLVCWKDWKLKLGCLMLVPV